jgi:tRNA G46 methylase TrmB
MALDAAWRFAQLGVIVLVRHRLHAFCSTRRWHTKKQGAEIMEYIIGKQTYTLDRTDFASRLHHYQQIVMDIGTGDGRSVAYLAKRSPD